MNTRIIVIAFAALLAGCESSSPANRPGLYVKPGLIMVPADQAHFYGLSSPRAEDDPATQPPPGYPATDVRSVQTEAPVTAIQLNRYVDPARPDELMHEAHIVYRRESSPRWRLQPPAPGQQVLVGPTLTDGRGEVQPLASQELDAYLREQRANVQKQQQVLGQVTEGMRQLSEQQQQLAKELAKLQAERGAHTETKESPSAAPPTDPIQEGPTALKHES